MSDRDFHAEMNDLLDSATPDGDFVAAVLAAEIAEKLRANDPELLAGYLDAHAEQVIATALAVRLRQRRTRQRRNASTSAFADAAEKFADDGDGEDLLSTVRHVVDDAGTWRRLGDMTGADHRFVAGRYHRDSTTASMLAAFHEAVARKLRSGKKTSDVFDAPKYEALYRSITKTELTAA